MTDRKFIVKSIQEMADDYTKFAKQSDEMSLDLSDWLPSFRRICRPIIAGELVFIVADTGIGKSMCLQNIANSQSESSLFFEMELPANLMFERFMATAHKIRSQEILDHYKYDRGYLSLSELAHIYVCDVTRLSKDQMKSIILNEATQKIGIKPLMIYVDYIGLMNAPGKSRYERVSIAAEELKVLAKETETIIIAAAQIARPAEDEEIHIHSAKDSGSIESSAGLLLGLYRDKDAPQQVVWIKILKNTKGRNGDKIMCNIDGERMLITERTKEWTGEYQDEPQAEILHGNG